MNICGFKAVYCPCSTPRQETSSAELKKKHRIPSVEWDWLTLPHTQRLVSILWISPWSCRVIQFLLFYLGVCNVKNGFSMPLYPESQGLGTPCPQRHSGVGSSCFLKRSPHLTLLRVARFIMIAEQKMANGDFSFLFFSVSSVSCCQTSLCKGLFFSVWC